MVDVILINPKNFFEDNVNGPIKKGLVMFPPVGLLYLASYLEREGISVKVIDAIASNKSIRNIVDIISKEMPCVIGITATTPQAKGGVQLARRLRKNFGSKITIAIGGAHISADPGFFNRFKLFDFAILGEGEITFAKKVKQILKGETVNGIYPGEEINNLDNYPFPARHLLDLDKYYLEPYGKYFATIHTARGCPFDCNFCSNPVTGRKVRFRSPKNVIDEIKNCIHKYNIKYIIFTDDTFTLSQKRTEEICEEIINENIIINWSCETRANLVDENLLRLMYKAGCREVSFGVETGVERLRINIIRKKIFDKDIIEAFLMCRKLGIETNAYCMLGFPGESRKDMYETLSFALKIKPTIIGLHLTVPLPGSDLYKQAINEKKITEDVWDQYINNESNYQPVYIPDDFSLMELAEVQKDIYIKYYLRPEFIFNRLKSDIKDLKRLKHDIRMGLKLIQTGGTGTGRP